MFLSENMVLPVPVPDTIFREYFSQKIFSSSVGTLSGTGIGTSTDIAM